MCIFRARISPLSEPSWLMRYPGGLLPKEMKLATKTTVRAGGAVGLATLGAIGTVYSISHTNRVNELKVLMSSTIQQAGTVTENVDALQQSGAFNLQVLSESLKQTGGDFRNSTLYRSIPVVAGRASVRRVAETRGFEFLTPSRPGTGARNPSDNTSEFDDAFSCVCKRATRVLSGR